MFYISYNVDAWQKIPLRNFTLKNCLFGVTNGVIHVIFVIGRVFVYVELSNTI